MPCKGIWIGFLASGGFKQVGVGEGGGGDMMKSLWLQLEEGLEGEETRGRGISGAGLEASMRVPVRDEKSLSQGRGGATGRGESWGRQAGGHLQRPRGRRSLGRAAALSPERTELWPRSTQGFECE